MTTTNYRTKKPQAMVINGVDAGGMMTARIWQGYDNIISNPADGLEVPLRDRECQAVRGDIISQDWVHLIDLLTGAAGTGIFYERNSGVAVETGYTKYTLNAPVIHRASLNFAQGGYATCNYSFECKPADETKGIADMFVPLAEQAAPSYISAARGGYRILSAVHGVDPDDINIYHLTAFSFNLTLNLVKACNDGDIGYTCCEAELDNLAAGGSISFQDSSIASSKILAQQLLLAARANLVLNIRQAQGATAKTITIAGVEFDTADMDSAAANIFTGHTVPFTITNDLTTQLTLAGTNKIITIE